MSRADPCPSRALESPERRGRWWTCPDLPSRPALVSPWTLRRHWPPAKVDSGRGFGASTHIAGTGGRTAAPIAREKRRTRQCELSGIGSAKTAAGTVHLGRRPRPDLCRSRAIPLNTRRSHARTRATYRWSVVLQTVDPTARSGLPRGQADERLAPKARGHQPVLGPSGCDITAWRTVALMTIQSHRTGLVKSRHSCCRSTARV